MLSEITIDKVKQIFPFTPVAHIAANLPFVIDALGAAQCDRTMAIMALATIRAETESFLPEAEQTSKYNTSPGGSPFGLYDHRADLGNQGPPDGERFRGRGYVQLTGRANYLRLGTLMGIDLVGSPDSAAEPHIASTILVRFLMLKESQIRTALQTKNLAAARKLVNGGSHGLDRFSDAYQKAQTVLTGLPLTKPL
jgi:putative chitinase